MRVCMWERETVRVSVRMRESVCTCVHVCVCVKDKESVCVCVCVFRGGWASLYPNLELNKPTPFSSYKTMFLWDTKGQETAVIEDCHALRDRSKMTTGPIVKHSPIALIASMKNQAKQEANEECSPHTCVLHCFVFIQTPEWTICSKDVYGMSPCTGHQYSAKSVDLM